MKLSEKMLNFKPVYATLQYIFYNVYEKLTVKMKMGF